MRICQQGHSPIVHIDNRCPLCALTEHNNTVHDFIESKGRGLVGELVAFQHRKTSETGAEQTPNTGSPKCPHYQPLANCVWQGVGSNNGITCSDSGPCVWTLRASA